MPLQCDCKLTSFLKACKSTSGIWYFDMILPALKLAVIHCNITILWIPFCRVSLAASVLVMKESAKTDFLDDHQS